MFIDHHITLSPSSVESDMWRCRPIRGSLGTSDPKLQTFRPSGTLQLPCIRLVHACAPATRTPIIRSAITQLLEEAINKVMQLPPDAQDTVAAIILAELEDEAKWDKAFASSQDQLAKMAQEALSEFRAGKTEE